MIERPPSAPRFGLAVNGLHDELAASTPESADVVAEYVDRCWEGSAPASIRVLRPVNGAELADVQADYTRQLQQLGFSAESIGSSPVQSRERDDALDGDIVRFRVDDGAKTLTVVADNYDVDSVVCLPL